MQCCLPRLAAGQSSREAEDLLGRSFEVRQHSPAVFALLCDELTAAVRRGQLSAALREWLKLFATDQLEAFLDDFTDSPPNVQVHASTSVSACTNSSC